MEQKLNHRERRLQAKRESRTLTCGKHPSVRLVIKGTQTICPQCYFDYLAVHKRGVFSKLPPERQDEVMAKVNEVVDAKKKDEGV